MYLVGTFNRDYIGFEILDNDNPLSLVGLVENITKDHLIKTQNEDDYQVIDLIKKEYYDPKQNKWLKIHNF